MAVEGDVLRDWHRLFGLLLADFFTGSPFVVEVERDLSQQQQLLDVVIVRRGRGRFVGRLPDGLDGLAAHNLITFKSHHEALDAWAMKELVGHYVAYRKSVSPSPSDLLPEDQFRLYAVCARFPHNLAQQAPWQERHAGVYDCRWGADVVRVVVAGELPREEQNAPLHLFSASPELVGFGGATYHQRSERTSRLLVGLLDQFEKEGFAMYTMDDFNRDYARKLIAELTPDEQREALIRLPAQTLREFLNALPPEWLLAALSPEQMRRHLDQATPREEKRSPKPKRKKK